MLKPDQTYEVVIPSIASNAGSYHDGTHWFACYRDKDHQGHWLGEGEAVAVINETKMALLQDEKRRADQLGANCDWLIKQIDAIHTHLCPGQSGTWQQKVEQAVAGAKEMMEVSTELGQAAALALTQREQARAELATYKEQHGKNN